MSEPPLEVSCRNVSDLRAAGDSLVLIDCREREEYERVHISGSLLLPMSEIATKAAELAGPVGNDPQAPIVVYCHHGGRSAQVTAWLRRNGYPAAQSMAGGIDRWAVEIEPGMERY